MDILKSILDFGAKGFHNFFSFFYLVLFEPYFFFYLFFLFLNFIFCWSGLFLLSSLSSWLLIFLSFILFFFIYNTEFTQGMVLLLFLIFLFGWLIFSSMNYFFLFMVLEISVIPLIIILLGYGSQVQKVQASLYLVFYASLCSMPMLWVFLMSDFFSDFPLLGYFFYSGVLLLFLLGFLMKFPVYFFHFWLPLVHVESPTSLSMYLAGVVLKFGVFGYMVFMYVLNWSNMYFLFFWSSVGVFFSMFSCISSSDTKVMAAYSSVVHMSFLFFLLNYYGFFSLVSVICMVLGHGFISFLWFYYIGAVYHSIGTRLVYLSGSFFTSSVLFFAFFSLVMMFNSGVPLSYSFFSEVLGVVHIFYTTTFFTPLLFFYYFSSFYYGTVLLISTSVGKKYFFFNFTSLNFVTILYLMNANFLFVT